MSKVTATQINNRDQSRILIPYGGGNIVQTVHKRVNDRIDYAVTTGQEITALNITITPKGIGNTILVDWSISGDINYNTENNIMVNGSMFFNGGFPTRGYAIDNDRTGANADNYTYLIFSSDGQTTTTPNHAECLFAYQVTRIEPLTFGIWQFGGNYHLNRTGNSATGSANNEITVSFVTAYEITGGL